MSDFHNKRSKENNDTRYRHNSYGNYARGSKNTSGMRKFMPLLTYAFLICCIYVFIWYSISGSNVPEPDGAETAQPPVSDDLPQIQAPSPVITSNIPPENTVSDEPGDTPVSPLLPPPVKVKGVYVMAWNAGVPEYMAKYIELCETTELNALVIDVKDDEGNITFNTSNKDLSAACMNIVPGFKELVSDLKSRGIYTIARIVCFRDEQWSSLNPDLAIQHKDGGLWKDSGGRTWLDPYDRGAWEYISDIAEEAVLLGFDEIQLDYVRFPTDGRIGDISYGSAAEETSKTEIISEFLKSLRAELAEDDVRLSADVFGIIALSRSDSVAIGQDTALLLDSTDSICPMIYPSHFANKRQNGVGQYINGVLFEAPDLDPYGVVYNALMEFKRYLNDDGSSGDGSINKDSGTVSNTANNTVNNTVNTDTNANTSTNSSTDINGSNVGTAASNRNDEINVNQAVIRPYLQHFSASYLGEGYYQQYTAEEVREQINAVYDAGFEEWILWNHNSVYSTDAFIPISLPAE